MNRLLKVIKKTFLFSLFFFLISFSVFGADTTFQFDLPSVISGSDGRFPQTLQMGSDAYVFWQEVNTSAKKIQIMCARYSSETKDVYKPSIKRLMGTFDYSGDVPELFTAQISKEGTILVAVPSVQGITIFTSTNKCETFYKKVIRTDKTAIGPRAYITSNGSFRLFYSLVDEYIVENQKNETVSAESDTEVPGENETAIESTENEEVETERVFNLYYIDSSDGIIWSNQKLLELPKDIINPFIPCLIPFNGGDLVVFQAQKPVGDKDLGTVHHYQLYKTITYDNGKTWSKRPEQLANTVATVQDQSPYLFSYKGDTYIVWERSTGEKTSIMFSTLSKSGNLQSTPDDFSSASGKASRGKLFEYDDGLYLVWFESNAGKDTTIGKIQLRRMVYNGNRYTEIPGEKNGSARLDASSSVNLFPSPLILFDKDGEASLNFICQQRLSNGAGRISLIGPDRKVDPPKLIPRSYTLGKRSAKRDVEIDITYPNDISGISGYVYTWGLDNQVEPEQNPDTRNKRPIKLVAEQDGIYTLRVIIADNAKNWSESKSVNYYHDITPPSKPEINPDYLDDYGFVKSSDSVIKWFPSIDENKDGSPYEASSYKYDIQYLGEIPDGLAVNRTHRILISHSKVQNQLDKLADKYSKKVEKGIKLTSTTTRTSTLKLDKENGVYLFSVAAVDEVGNVSEPNTTLIYINKYQPETRLKYAEASRTKTGELEGYFEGTGFTYEGIISHIYIDKDGKKNKNGHYDLELSRDNGDFKVKSDKVITNIKIGTALGVGSYKVGLIHTDRGGPHFTQNAILTLKEESGTIRYIPEYEYKPKYRALSANYKYIIAINWVIVIIIATLVIITVLILTMIISAYTREKVLIQEEINSLARGENMPSLRSKTKTKNRKSLKGKIVMFTVVLVILVVGGITAYNVADTLSSQGEFLKDSFENRVEVLLGSIDSGVTSFMPGTKDTSTNGTSVSNLADLPSQKDALVEADYITILGAKDITRTSEENTSENKSDTSRMIYVWASNDTQQDEKFDYSETDSGRFEGGATKILIPSSDSNQINADLYKIILRMENLNKDTIAELNSYSTQITDLNNQIKEINTKKAENRYLEQSEESRINKDNEYQDDLDFKISSKNKIQSELTEKFSQIEKENSGSIPEFNGISIDMNNTKYLFYKPVLYRDEVDEGGNLTNVFCGLIVMEVDVNVLKESLTQEVDQILISGLIIAIIAIIAGALGSWFLASIIVRPIQQLESHIQEVGSLLTKSARERMRLQKMEIEVKSQDEIGRLGEVVNKMSSTVAKAAEDEYLNMDAKVVQERFVPLSDGEGGKKLPIVKHTEEKLDIFAFYKGDSEVSGDYFDYRELDERWVVFIKCDVSGHGTPAALLVSVLATKFKEFYYYSNWNYKTNGINLVEFVSTVNDFIYDLGTRGKFSTINISLYNKDTGELYTCNAGDNKLDVYESDKRRLRRITLANAPTAGGLSTDLIMMSGGFKVEKTMLRHGDILYLYTDGIDEAERLVRHKDYSVKQERKESTKFNPRTGKEEKTVQILDVKEQFGEERVRRVIEAVLNRRKFILEKEENPAKEILEFDFTNCKGTSEESILALAAVERVFRLVKMPDVKPNDEIEIEKMLDDFLKDHFALYSSYCRPAVQTTEESRKKSKKKKTQVEFAVRVEDNPNVTRYGYIVEDKQADDITLIAIRRP